MLIAIFSDVHDNPLYLEKFLNWSRENKIEKAICCGDVGSIETIKRLSVGFAQEILLVRGNLDHYDGKELAKFKNIIFYDESGFFEIDGLNVGFCHEPYKIKKILEDHKNVRIIFYGHTHKPWIEKKDGVQMVNPGTMGGLGCLSTLAFWDTEKKEIKLIKLDDI